MARDDFSKQTIEVLADRAGNRCSNPNCRQPTSGPQTDPDRAVNIGVAAHITAASEGGPRYDPALTPNERRHADNGLWLCQTCAKLVDSDPKRYTVDVLRQWKLQAEAEAEKDLRCRNRPEVPAAASSNPSNLREAIAPVAGYADRLSIVAFVVLPPLAFLSIRWCFFPSGAPLVEIAVIGGTLFSWATFLAALAQFTGVSVHDFWHKGNLSSRWTKIMVGLALVLLAVFLVTTSLAVMQRLDLVERQNSLASEHQILLLVAEFSEGASHEIPTDRTITQNILEGLQKLAQRDPTIAVRGLGEVVLDPETAMKFGRHHGAMAVIWGTYARSPTSVLLEPHLRLVSPVVSVYAEGYLTEPRERLVDIEELHSFRVHLDLKEEMAFLSSFVAGLAYYSEERYDEALASFDAALELSADSESLGLESVHYYKGLIFRQQEKYVEAEKEFQESITINRTMAAAYNALGMTYDQQNQGVLAIEQYMKAIDIDPQFASAYNNLAVAYGVQKKPVAVRIQLYLKALEIKPDNIIIRQNLGLLYQGQRRYEDALAEFQKAIEANAHDAASYFYLATVYTDMARWKEAQEAIHKSLQLDPDRAAAHNWLGALYSEAGHSRRAILEYKRALEIKPDFAAAHGNLGLEYESRGDLEQARIEYETAVNLDPEEAVYQCRLGRLYEELGRPEEGDSLIAECERLVDIDPENPSAHNELGMVYRSQERYSEALLEFQRAAQLEPNEWALHSNLSATHENLGQLQLAIQEAELVLRLSPDRFSSHDKLLRLHWAAHNYREAIKQGALAVLRAPMGLKALLAAELMALFFTAYVFGDKKCRDNATRQAAYLRLRCLLRVLAIVRQALARVDMYQQDSRWRKETVSFARAMTVLGRLIASVHLSLGNVCLLQHRKEEAIKELQTALELAPAELTVAHQLIGLHIGNHDLPAAHRVAQRAIKAQPTDALMYLWLGDIYLAWNMIDEAVHEWNMAVKNGVDAVVSARFEKLLSDPLSIPAHFTLGLAFAEKGETEKAMKGFAVTVRCTDSPILKHYAERMLGMLQPEQLASAEETGA